MINLTNKLKEKKRGFFSKVAVFVVVFAALLQLFVAHLLVGQGEELVRIEKKVQAVVAENKAFQEELYRYSSLSEISARGRELGYIKPQNLIYFNDASSANLLGLNNILEKR